MTMRKIQNLVEILKQFSFDLSLLICKLGKIRVPAQCDQCKDSITYELQIPALFFTNVAVVLTLDEGESSIRIEGMEIKSLTPKTQISLPGTLGSNREKKFIKACWGQMASLSSRLILKLPRMFINGHLITQSPSRWAKPGVYHIKQNI